MTDVKLKQVQSIIKQYIQENLEIEIERRTEFGPEEVAYVTAKIDGETICESSISLD